MAAPKLFFGTRSTNALLEVGRGFLDRAIAYDLYAKTDPWRPAGLDGESIFPSLYAVVSFTASVTLYLTPYVDGVALETKTISLVQNGSATRQTRAFELGLSVPVAHLGTTRARVAPRGTVFQVLAETRHVLNATTPTQVIIEGLSAEYEVVRESMQPGTAR